MAFGNIPRWGQIQGDIEEQQDLFNTFLTITNSNNFVKLDQTTPQEVINGFLKFKEGITLEYLYSFDLSTSLDLHLKLNDNAADTVVLDSSVQAHTVTSLYSNTDVMTTTGKINTALNFDGSNDCLETDFININTDYTMSLWLYNTRDDLTYGIFGDADPYSYNYGFCFDKYMGSIRFLVGGGSLGGLNSSNLGKELNEWVFYTITASNGNLYLYRNGVLIAQGTTTGNPFSSAQLWIGKRQGSGNFQGVIDDFRWYNRALTQSEIDVLYNNGNGTESTPTFEGYIDVPLKVKSLMTGLNDALIGVDENGFMFRNEKQYLDKDSPFINTVILNPISTPSNPSAGQLYFDGYNFYGYNGSTWVQLN